LTTGGQSITIIVGMAPTWVQVAVPSDPKDNSTTNASACADFSTAPEVEPIVDIGMPADARTYVFGQERLESSQNNDETPPCSSLF